MKYLPALRPAVVAFVVILVLTVGTGTIAFRDSRSQLSQQFANQEYLTARYTAEQLTSVYDLFGMVLQNLSASPADGTGAPPRTLPHLQTMLGGALVGVYRFSPDGTVTGQWPDRAPLPPAAIAAKVLRQAQASDRPVPSFYLGEKGRSQLLILARTVSSTPAAEAGAMGVILDPAWILTPPMLAEAGNVELHLLAMADLTVLASSGPLTFGSSFETLFGPGTTALFEGLKRGDSGTEKNAISLPSFDGQGNLSYLIGAQGLELGGLRLVLVATVPRHELVDGFLTHALRWIGLLGLVGLLGLLSFVAIALQSRSEVKQERRRNLERSFLLKISHALLSEHDLEEVLRKIVDEARALFGSGGVTIALVDPETDELVFRAVASHSEEVVKQLQGLRMARERGVLGWVVTQGEGAIVNDVRTDPRFADEVDEQTGAQTNSLCCAPLKDQAGATFGAIELVNNREDPFVDSDLVLLQSLAAIASAAVERAVFVERQAQQQRLRREMDIAATVQKGLLPQAFPDLAGYDLSGANTPAREVGGDFFDFIAVSDDHLGVVIADVADKGLGAAMFMVMCRSLLYAAASRELSPARVLTQLNQKIVEVSRSDLFVTVFYGLLDIPHRRFRFSNGGHNPPLVYRQATGTIESITVPGMALGVLDPLEFDEAEISLEAGDRIVLYTDGISEAINADEEAFGMDRLEAVLRETAGAGAGTTAQEILAAVDRFVDGAPQFDDMTLALVAVEPEDAIDPYQAALERR